MRINIILRGYCAANSTKKGFDSLSDPEWEAASEVEACLNYSKPLTTFMQCEALYTSSYGTVIKRRRIEQLHHNHVNVIDMPKVTPKVSWWLVRTYGWGLGGCTY